MPARWATVCFQELPSPCFREGALGTREPHSAWQLPTKHVVPWRCHLCVTDTWLRGEHTPDPQGCPLCATVAVSPG